MSRWKIPLFDTRFGAEELEAVQRPLKARWLTMGEEVLKLEEEIRAASGGKPLGLHGAIGCFSFYSNKNATSGEGGALLTQDADLAHRMRLLRSHGMTVPTLDRHNGRATSYDVVLPGFNCRMDEIRAALM